MTKTVFSSIVRNSLRHLWRKRAFWVIQGLLGLGPLVVSVIVYLVNPNDPVALGVNIPGIGTLALNYLLLPFLVLPAILDDFGKIGEILWSGPLDNVVYFAARFSGLWLGLASGSLIQLAGWFLASLVWFNIVTEWIWLLSLAIYLLANTLALCTVFLLAVLIRRNLPVMLAWAALWVWLWYIVVFEEGLSEGFNPMITLAFTNIFFHNVSLSPSLGLGLVQGHIVGMFAWFLGLSLVFFSLALLLAPVIDQRRSTRTGMLAVALAGAALLAAVGGYLLNAQGIAAHDAPLSPHDVQADAWQVLSQHTEVEVDAKRGTIAGAASLELALVEEIKEPVVVLRLNTGLELTARDAAGKTLAVERLGDSVLVNLPAIPDQPVTLNLEWNGRLQIPYLAFEQRWIWYDAPDNYKYNFMPQALMGFIQPNGGFLLRDGDWMPWPWTSQPHQAQQNYLEIRPLNAPADASVPLEDGKAIWQGAVPEGLLVFLPGKQMTFNNMTIAVSPLASSQHSAQAFLFARAAMQFSDLTGVPPPRVVAVVPYLNKLIWNDDLLLIPDASGDYIERTLEWLYTQNLNNTKMQGVFSRASMNEVAREFLHNQLKAPAHPIKALIYIDGQDPDVVVANSYTPEYWAANGGRWAQVPELFDYVTDWSFRRRININDQGEWSALAFWLALELADEETRQADLEALVYFDNTHPNDDASERFAVMRARILPGLLEDGQGREIVYRMHDLALQFGTKEIITTLMAVLQETHPQTITELFTEMDSLLEIPQTEVQP